MALPPKALTSALTAVFALTLFAGARPGAAAHTDGRAASATRLCDSSSASRIPQPTARHLVAAGLKGLPIAPKRKRVDLVAPPFSNSTNITNPLFPISKLHSAILNGRVSGKVFRVETTLLPARIHGGKASACGPSCPKVGDVHRPENIPGLSFEEVAVKAVDKTMAGSRGQVRGALVGRELHDDGTFSDKVFAPGYGEFFTAYEGDVEALALAVPTDALSGSMPRELARLLSGANAIFAGIGGKRWKAAAATLGRMETDWEAPRARGVPPRLVSPTSAGLAALSRAVAARDSQRSRNAALDVVQTAASF